MALNDAENKNQIFAKNKELTGKEEILWDVFIIVAVIFFGAIFIYILEILK